MDRVAFFKYLAVIEEETKMGEGCSGLMFYVFFFPSAMPEMLMVFSNR